MKISRGLLLTMVGLLLAGITDAFSQTKQLESNIIAVRSSDYQMLYELKREMLLSELQSRAEAQANSESILYSCRIALLTVLTGLIAYLFERRREVRAKEDGKRNSYSRLAILGISVLILCMYWTDCYLINLQHRVEERVNKIVTILNTLPFMTASEMQNIKIFESLEYNKEKYFCLIQKEKIWMLWSPNFAQVLIYSPLFLIFILFSIDSIIKSVKKGKSSNGQQWSGTSPEY